MELIDEYRDPALAQRLLAGLGRRAGPTRTVMEVCGGQTHTLVRSGLLASFPPWLRVVHGPGCPVCVTPAEEIERAIALARRPNATLCSFGDMLRVPGTSSDLLQARSEGADVRVVYSPLDALALAKRTPTREVVFFAVGFETTAPATALAVLEAKRAGVTNFSLIAAHVRVPPALEMLLADPERRVEGFLAAGHVCAVMGLDEYEAIVAKWRVPIVVAGFEPIDLLAALAELVRLLDAGEAVVRNAYGRVVRTEGNRRAREALDAAYEPCDRPWRGLGVVRAGGLRLRAEFADFDASRRWPLPVVASAGDDPRCLAAEVLLGKIAPTECSAFGTDCTPERPLGAPMVSSEGACAAYRRYRARGA